MLTINYYHNQGAEGGVQHIIKREQFGGGGEVFREGFWEEVTFKCNLKNEEQLEGEAGGGASQAGGPISAKALSQGRAGIW